jgi:Peroxisomal biogenesis factor 11 (PEX11)
MTPVVIIGGVASFPKAFHVLIMVKAFSPSSHFIHPITKEEPLSASRSSRSLSDVESDDDNNDNDESTLHLPPTLSLPSSNYVEWNTPPRFPKNDSLPVKELFSTLSTEASSSSVSPSGYTSTTSDSQSSSIYQSPTRLLISPSVVPSTPLIGSFARNLLSTEETLRSYKPSEHSFPTSNGTDESQVNRQYYHHGNMVTTASMVHRRRIPLIPLREGVRHKAVFGLDSITALLLNLDGRDKVTKLLQYLCRFIAWWLAAQQSSQVRSIERFTALKASLSNSRKAYRLGRSLVEVEKLRSLGLLQWLDQFLRQHSGDAVQTKSLIPSLYNVAYCLYHPLVPSPPSISAPAAPFWQIAGNAIKCIGLLGFWAADNVSFLALSGFLDNVTDPNRLSERARMVSQASAMANRSYFVGAVAGLVVNWKSYWDQTKTLHQQAASIDSSENSQVALQKAQEKQFALFVAFLKSVCDVLVFSNNPGIDLWKRYRGRPMHEGFHCLCGLVSASTVLYANYPNAPKESAAPVRGK